LARKNLPVLLAFSIKAFNTLQRHVAFVKPINGHFLYLPLLYGILIKTCVLLSEKSYPAPHLSPLSGALAGSLPNRAAPGVFKVHGYSTKKSPLDGQYPKGSIICLGQNREVLSRQRKDSDT